MGDCYSPLDSAKVGSGNTHNVMTLLWQDRKFIADEKIRSDIGIYFYATND